MKSINVFHPVFRTSEILNEIELCLEKGWTGSGFKTVEFEESWSKYTGLKQSHFLSSNTVGLHLAIKILKMVYEWKDGDEIITTPLTFVSTNHSILYERLKPIFADVDKSLCLDPESVKAKINNRTKAVMYVGMGGNTGQLEKISKICKDRNLRLILDAAHMAGTYVNYSHPTHVGKEADISVFSFQAVKNLPTADSGMICFRNPEFQELAKKLTWLGIDKDTYSRSTSGSYSWEYDVPHLGYKYHGNSIIASMGLVQLRYLDQDNDRRNEIADLYDCLIGKSDDLDLVKKSDYCYKSSRHLYQVLIKKVDRNKLMNHFYENSIFPGVHYNDNTNYAMYQYAKGTCPNAHAFSKQLITLPIHLKLSDKDVSRVVKVLKEGLQL